MPLEIVGPGFGRTGTYSLKLALEQLGEPLIPAARPGAGPPASGRNPADGGRGAGPGSWRAAARG